MAGAKKFGEQEEKRYAEERDSDYKRHRSSGSSRFEPGDGRDNYFTYDIKSTSGKSVSVTLDMLDKIADEANETGRAGVIVLNYVSGGRYFVIGASTFYLLLQLLEEVGDGEV